MTQNILFTLALVITSSYPAKKTPNSTIKAKHLKVLNKICFHYGFASERTGKGFHFCHPHASTDKPQKNPRFRCEAIC